MASDDETAGGRATTAMVLRAVDDQGRIMSANFTAVHARLDGLSKIPERVDVLEREVDHVKLDVGLLKTARVEDVRLRGERRSYRIGTLPALLIGFVTLLFGAVNVYALLAG